MGTNFLSIADVTRHGRPARWGLDYYSPWDLGPDGNRKRVKEFFRTKELRSDRRRELEDRYGRLGASASQAPTTDELEDFRAMKAVLPAGVTAAKAARYYVANAAAERDGGLLLLSPEKSADPGLFDRYVDSMRARRLDAAWIKQADAMLKRFGHFMPAGTRVREVTKQDGRRWMASLTGYSDETRNNMRRCLHGAFEWAVREEMLEVNPFARVEVPRVRRGAPVFYTVQEVRALLAACVRHYPDYVRFLALRLFAGIRKDEIRRMLPSDVDIKRRKIDVPGWRSRPGPGGRDIMQRVTKSGERHLIQDAPDVLWDWLAHYPVLNTANHLSKFRRLHRWADVKPKRNGFRHTFATYHVTLHGNANLTMHILGQEEDSKAFFAHYRGHVDKEEATAFFRLYRSAVLRPTSGRAP